MNTRKGLAQEKLGAKAEGKTTRGEDGGDNKNL
jgi:hypothetical protein